MTFADLEVSFLFLLWSVVLEPPVSVAGVPSVVACTCPGVAPSAEPSPSPPCASSTVLTALAPSASASSSGGGASPWSHYFLPVLPYAREGMQSQSESDGWLPSQYSHAWPPALPRRH